MINLVLCQRIAAQGAFTILALQELLLVCVIQSLSLSHRQTPESSLHQTSNAIAVVDQLQPCDLREGLAEIPEIPSIDRQDLHTNAGRFAFSFPL